MEPLRIVGEKYGRLTVKSRAENDKHGKTRWLCECSCGKQTVVTGTALRTGNTSSCGCLWEERDKTKMKIHGEGGKKRTTEYIIWNGMMTRCYSKGSKDFPNYGGRGITVCERWHNFVNFKSDMGERPKGLSIDRINNNKGYSPDNCRWATASEQAKNTRERKRNSKGQFN